MSDGILHKLKAPFPFSRGVKRDFLSAIRVVVIVTVLLFFIRPFGLDSSSTAIIIGFGLTGLFSALINIGINYGVIAKSTNHEKWNVGKEIIRSLIFLLFFTTLLIVYAKLMLGVAITSGNIFQFLGYTTIIGVIPISTRVILLQNQLLKIELENAQQLNSKLFPEVNDSIEKTTVKQIVIKSNVVNETFESNNMELAYIEANQNYIKIGILKEDVFNEELFRISLVNALAQTSDDCLIRCHRSYAFNPKVVHKVTGNSQGLKLLMKGTDKIIPVSRSFKDIVESRLQELKTAHN